MKAVDRLLQKWRMHVVSRNIPAQSRVIDIGAHRGEFFTYLGNKLQSGFGVEPLLTEPICAPSFSIMPGFFPSTKPKDTDWDVITMLAVLEHIPRDAQAPLANACFDLLKPGGRVIVTVPSPFVDRILDVLKLIKLIDGMSLEEHFGFLPNETSATFSQPRFKLIKHKRFQLGLNHLFILEKIAEPLSIDTQSMLVFVGR